jgi:hypothetical protein
VPGSVSFQTWRSSVPIDRLSRTDVRSAPLRRPQLPAYALDRVDLDHDAPVEILSDTQPEIFVGRPGEAVRAGVGAAAVRVDRVAERHTAGLGDVVDHPSGVDMKELQPAVLARTHVAFEDRFVREQRGGQVLVLGTSPAKGQGACVIGHVPQG